MTIWIETRLVRLMKRISKFIQKTMWWISRFAVSHFEREDGYLLQRFAIQQQSTAPQSGHAVLRQVRSMCSWTLPCISSLVPSILHLSHGFQCSPTLNRQPYEGRLPLTSWWRKSWNMTVGQYSNRVLTSLGNSCLYWTMFTRNRDTAVPAEERATYRHWSVSLWRDPDDVPHCRNLSLDKTEWRFISATLCGWRQCFMADQLWFLTRIREEEEENEKTVIEKGWQQMRSGYCWRQCIFTIEKVKVKRYINTLVFM